MSIENFPETASPASNDVPPIAETESLLKRSLPSDFLMRKLIESSKYIHISLNFVLPMKFKTIRRYSNALRDARLDDLQAVFSLPEERIFDFLLILSLKRELYAPYLPKVEAWLLRAKPGFISKLSVESLPHIPLIDVFLGAILTPDFFDRLSIRNASLAVILLSYLRDLSLVKALLESNIDYFKSDNSALENIYCIISKGGSDLDFKNPLLRAMTSRSIGELQPLLLSPNISIAKFAARKVLCNPDLTLHVSKHSFESKMEIINAQAKTSAQLVDLGSDLISVAIALLSDKAAFISKIKPTPDDLAYFERLIDFAIMPIISCSNELIYLVPTCINLYFEYISTLGFSKRKFHLKKLFTNISSKYIGYCIEKLSPEDAFALKYLKDVPNISSKILKLLNINGPPITTSDYRNFIELALSDEFYQYAPKIVHRIEFEDIFKFRECLFDFLRSLASSIEESNTRTLKKHEAANLNDRSSYAISRLKRCLNVFYYAICHDQRYISELWRLSKRQSTVDIVRDLFNKLRKPSVLSKLPPDLQFTVHSFRTIFDSSAEDIKCLSPLVNEGLVERQAVVIFDLLESLISSSFFSEELRLIVLGLVIAISQANVFAHVPNLEDLIDSFILSDNQFASTLCISLIGSYVPYLKSLKAKIPIASAERLDLHDISLEALFSIISKEISSDYSGNVYRALSDRIKLHNSEEASLTQCIDFYNKLFSNRTPAVRRGDDVDLTAWKREVLVNAMANFSFDEGLTMIFLNATVRLFLNDPFEAIRTLSFRICDANITKAHYPILKQYISEFSKDKTSAIPVYLFSLLTKLALPDDEKSLVLSNSLLPALENSEDSIQAAAARAIFRLGVKDDVLRSKFISCLTGRAHPNHAKRGAAYGLSSIIPLPDDIIAEFFSKKDILHKFACTQLLLCCSVIHGIRFEHVAIKYVPELIVYCGDSSVEIRNLAVSALRTIIKNCITEVGFRCIVPQILNEISGKQSGSNDLPEKNWRSYQHSINVLSSAIEVLPISSNSSISYSILASLIELIASNSFVEVTHAANDALLCFSKSLKSPEIQSHAQLIVSSICDPKPGNLSAALDSVCSISFSHAVDSTSFCLLVPLIRKCIFVDISTDDVNITRLKRNAYSLLAILIAKLVDPRHIMPFEEDLFFCFYEASLDISTTFKSYASRCIGLLFKHIHVPNCTDLCFNHLKCKNVYKIFSNLRNGTPDEQQSSALIIAEILTIMDINYIKYFFSNFPIDKNLGCIWLLYYLPVMIEKYELDFNLVYSKVDIDRFISVLFECSADSKMPVSLREVAGKALRLYIIRHSRIIGLERIFSYIIDSLNASISVKLVSLQILFELFRKIVPEHKYGSAAEYLISEDLISRHSIRRLQGHIFLCKYESENDSFEGSDSLYVSIRSSANAIWKVLSSHSPRSLLDIWKILINEILNCKNFNSRRATFYNASTVVVDKYGDRILGEIFDILSECDEQNIDKALLITLWIVESPSFSEFFKGSSKEISKITGLIKKGSPQGPLDERCAAIFGRIIPAFTEDSQLKELIADFDDTSLAALISFGGDRLAKIALSFKSFGSSSLSACSTAFVRSNFSRILTALTPDGFISLFGRIFFDPNEYSTFFTEKMLDFIASKEHEDVSFLFKLIGEYITTNRVCFPNNFVQRLFELHQNLVLENASLLVLFTPEYSCCSNPFFEFIRCSNDFSFSSFSKLEPAHSVHFVKVFVIFMLNNGYTENAIVNFDQLKSFQLDSSILNTLSGLVIRLCTAKRDNDSYRLLESIVCSPGIIHIKAFYPQILRLLKSVPSPYLENCLSRMIPCVQEKLLRDIFSDFNTLTLFKISSSILESMDSQRLQDLKILFQERSLVFPPQ